MNLLWFSPTIPMLFTLLGGLTLIDICERYNGELRQACFEDAFWLPIYGLIIATVMFFVIYLSNKKPLQEYQNNKK